MGLSDHSLDNKVAIGAVALGATVIEKHIALKNQRKGLDIKFSLKGKEIKKFKKDLIETYYMTKKDYFFRSKSEMKNTYLRRSIFAIAKIKRGQKFSIKNVKCLRPSYGASPKYFNKILSKKANKNFYKGDPIQQNDIKKII